MARADVGEYPVDAARGELLEALSRGPVVLSAPTGSGKSTRVPSWCAEAGRVLVVEPRRVACRSLAARVAELDGSELGRFAGYRVRDETRVSDATRIEFVTPGVALRALDSLDRFATVILDEFHERRLDTDLLLALLERRAPSLVVMSATIAGDRLAEHLGGSHVHAEGRMHPVEVRWAPKQPTLPDARDLTQRVVAAVRASRDDAGDVLVFLPGKGEIADAARALGGSDDEVLELHGGLSLDDQARVFAPCARRKIILATNVAETSVTVPGIGVVIDSGLVRRTRYHQGRGSLSLVPIAKDSAEQRTGRAGRTGPGVCYRLWQPAGQLEPVTPPEMHREALAPLVLGAAACGEDVRRLRFVDEPKQHALDDAFAELEALGALDAEGALTDTGRELFGLPLDAWQGRLLVEARERGTLADMVDLVSALSTSRPLFTAPPEDEDADLRAAGCDALALVRAVRRGKAKRHGLSRAALDEARATRKRLRAALELSGAPPENEPERDALLATVLAADPRTAHVARRRKRHVAWANGGTEIELGRESAIRDTEKVDAIVVLASRMLGSSARSNRIIATAASPVSLKWLARAGLGRERVAEVALKDGQLVTRIERVYAKRVLDARDDAPSGALARDAIVQLLLRGSLFREAVSQTRDRIEARGLAARLAKSGRIDAELEVPPELEPWLRARVDELGIESADDLALLSPEDFLMDDVDYLVRRVLDEEYPRTLSVGDARYRVEYDLAKNQVTLVMTRGTRTAPPTPQFLPTFAGFRICAEAGGTMYVVRERRR